MSDSEGSPQRDDRHHRRSRSPSPVSPGCAGKTLAEREERRLAEAAVPVGSPAGQPRAAPADAEPSTRGPAPAEETAPAAQAASPAAPPPKGAPGAQGAETAAPASRAAAPTPAPGTRPREVWPRHGPQAPRREPPQLQQRAGRVQSTAPTPTRATPTSAHPSRTLPRAPSLRDSRGPSAPRPPSVRRQASRCRSYGGNRTPGA